MTCPKAHSPKVEGIERDEDLRRQMVNAWRMRLALTDIGRFTAVDPWPARQRRSMDAHLAQRVARARMWLDVHQVALKHRMREARRKGWSVILGGRFAGGRS